MNAVDKTGLSALHYAVRNSNNNCVELLTKAGADVNIVEHNGASLLHLAAKSDSSNCAELLVQAGADVNAFDNNGFMPLIYACISGQENCTQTLIRAGADVNVVSTNTTALLVVIMHNNHGCVAALVQAGADVNKGVNTKQGKILPLHAACVNEFMTGKDMVKHVVLLLKAGVHVACLPNDLSASGLHLSGLETETGNETELLMLLFAA